MVFAEVAGAVLWCGERIALTVADLPRILTVVVHLRVALAVGSVDSSYRDVASPPLKVCVGIWAVAVLVMPQAYGLLIR